jgi:hypothetical protein
MGAPENEYCRQLFISTYIYIGIQKYLDISLPYDKTIETNISILFRIRRLRQNSSMLK